MRLPLLFALLIVASPAPAFAQKAVSIGSNQPGTAFYAIASGISKIVNDAGGAQMSVQPYSGTSTFLPLLDTGELEFGIVNAVDMALTYRGPKFGSPFLVGLLVRKDSPIKNVYDVKGKRMTEMDQAQRKLLAITP